MAAHGLKNLMFASELKEQAHQTHELSTSQSAPLERSEKKKAPSKEFM